MKKNKFLIFIINILFFLLLINSCGLPNIGDYDDLNTPTGLDIEDFGDGDHITITFNCYNYEPNFIGYNIYMVDTYDSSIDDLSDIVDDHITTDDDGYFERDYTIESYYIVKKDDSLPSITYDEVLLYYQTNYDPSIKQLYEECDDGEDCEYKLIPFEFEYKIDDDIVTLPNNVGELFVSGHDYILVVTAYGSDGSNYFESSASNQVDTSE